MKLGEILRLAARREPRKPAVVGDGFSLSYAEYDRLANRFAHFLLACGVRKGDRVACLLSNGVDYGAVHFGNARAGSVLVHLSPMQSPAEIARIVARTRPRVLVAGEEHVRALADLSSDAVPEVVVLRPLPAGGGLTEQVAGRPDDDPAAEVDASDPVAMTFTGGTTGDPKGAVVSHAARYVSAWTTALEHRVNGADVAAVVTPMFHTVGLMVWYQATVLAGCTAVIFPKWDAGAFIERVGRFGVSSTFLVPVQVRDLLDAPDFDAGRLASLANIGVGGAPTPEGLVAECRAALPGCDYTDHYGQSETGMLTALRPWEAEARPGSIGRPAVGVDLRIVDGEGRAVDAGEVGELVVRGPFMMDGYFEDEEETARYFRKGDGWGWTGALAGAPEDGVGTLARPGNEMIMTGRINVNPRELERIFETHPGVADCTVFGVPDERWGEALVAYVVRAPGTDLSGKALDRHCTGRLARYKRPREIVFVDAIPKTPSGKVRKPLLRDAYLQARAGGRRTGG